MLENEQEKKLSKKVLISIASISSIFLIIALIFVTSYIKKSQTIKQADALISMEKFQDGIAIYEGLLSEKYVPAIVAKRDSALELMDSSENFDKGVEAFDDENIGKAVKYLSKVPKEDTKRYKNALDKLNELEEVAYTEVDELIANDNLAEATRLVNEYLKASPNSEVMKNAKDTIASKHAEAENQAKAEEQAQKTKEAEEKKKAANAAASESKKNEAKNIAISLVGSTKTILTEEANLRIAPSLNSEIVMKVPRGSSVYINDTQIESSNRIWCQVTLYDDYGYPDGWISYNTMNYSMP